MLRLDRRYGDVQAVEMREEYRNRGIGGALLAAIMTDARARGLLRVTDAIDTNADEHENYDQV